MIPTDPRTQAAIDAAVATIAATVVEAGDRVVESLGLASMTSASNRQKQAFNEAQYELRKKQPLFVATFQDVFRERVARELAAGDAASRKSSTTDWASLTLVDDAEVEEQVAGDRIAQAIGLECEWELRELAGYLGALLPASGGAAGSGARPRTPRNPLAPDVLGRALYRAIEAVSDRDESRVLIAREMGQTMARAMRRCYAAIVVDLKARGIKPAGLTVRTTGAGPASAGPSAAAAAPPDPRDVAAAMRADAVAATPSMPDAERARLLGRMFGVPVPGRPNPGESTAFGGLSTGSLNTDFGTDGPYGDFPPIALPVSSTGNAALDAMAAHVGQDVQLMSLIRRLTDMASRPGDLGAATASPPDPRLSTGAQALAARAADSTGRAGPNSLRSGFAATAHAPSHGAAGGGSVPATGLMAVNLIRAHRDELMQASTGTLDHMVIDVVGSLFDQILSDPKVPPQMARQIARLQLPVLRVALADVGFFASRKHPVRRFVNRIASLACAFDQFDDGPGRTFLAEVTQLVRDIVAGDFDRLAVYEAKLASLEAFIGQTNEAEVEGRGRAASLLGEKETELRLQQRYMQQLTVALADVPTPDFIREFLAQVWSQAIMAATRRDGPDSAVAQRYRYAARNLVTSVQPKGTPALRKTFLMQLPPLMKDLNEGMNLIGWPEVARKAFFAQLLPLHAESLKGQPPSELQQSLLARQLESILEVPLPRAEQLSSDDGLPVLTDEVVEQRFSSEEAARLGLVEERSVDWDGLVDIDLGAELEAVALADAGPLSEPVDLELDFGTETTPAALSDTVQSTSAELDAVDTQADAAEPSSGSRLMDNLQLGFAYRMHVQGAWTKVKLSYVSPSRAFFVFTHGAQHPQTLSMTSRMLARMCETGRLRAFENAYLIERATARARQQLAALSAGAARH